MLEKRLLFITITIFVSLTACTGEIPTSTHVAVTLSSLSNSYTSQSETLTATLTQTPTPGLTSSPQLPATETLLPTTIPTKSNTFLIHQIRMFNKDSGWAIGGEKPEVERKIITDVPGWILRTIDGGKHWMNVSTVFPKGCYPRQAFFWDIDHAFAVCDILPETQSTKREVYPFRTGDGGRTWQSGEVFTIDFKTPFSPAQLFFLDENQGWLLGFVEMGHAFERGYGLFETKDGGMHWKMVNNPWEKLDSNHIEDFVWGTTVYPFQMNYLVFISPTIGFLPKRGYALVFVTLTRSEDGGKSWTPQPIVPLVDEVPIEEQHYGQFVSVPQFMTSTDGVLIQQIYISNEPVDAYGRFINAPDAAFLQYSFDSGQTWTPQTAPAKMGDVTFLDRLSGWYLGKDTLNPTDPNRLFQTKDGGKTWSVIAANSPLPLGSRMQFVDDQNGFALYSYANAPYINPSDRQMYANNYLFSTIDGGQTWTLIEPQLTP